MAAQSNIQWTDATWNIARGCTKVDEDCKYCYMYRDSFDGTRYNPREVVRTKTVFDLPLKLETPSKIFTCSLTDFFHEDIDNFREEAWDIIRRCPQHTFQILTKRPERILACLPSYWAEIRSRVWLGTSVGSMAGLKRIKELIKLRSVADILFVSFEPLYEEISTRWAYMPERTSGASVSHLEMLKNIDWAIIGGESGNETGLYRYRPGELSWMIKLIEECQEANTAVFVKQLGTYLSKELKLSDRHGGNMSEWPAQLQVRQFPKSTQA